MSQTKPLVLDQKLLKQYRLDKGLSQEALCNEFYAKNIQVSLATIKRAESGKAISARVAKAIADYLNLEISQLIQNQSIKPGACKQLKQAYMYVLLLRPDTFFSHNALHRQNTFKAINRLLALADIHIVNISGNYICGYSYTSASIHLLLKIFEQVFTTGRLLRGFVMSCFAKQTDIELSSQAVRLNQADLYFMESHLQEQTMGGLYIDSALRTKTLHHYHYELLPEVDNCQVWKYVSQITEDKVSVATTPYLAQFNSVLKYKNSTDRAAIFNIQGKSGSGKSHLIRRLINHFQEQNKFALYRATGLEREQPFSSVKYLVCKHVDSIEGEYFLDKLARRYPVAANWFRHEVLLEDSCTPNLSVADWQDILCLVFKTSGVQGVCVDDADHCDLQSKSILLQACEQQKLCLILVNADKGWTSNLNHKQVQNIALVPLDEQSCISLAQYWYGESLPEQVLPFLLLSTQGNPLLLKKLLASKELFESDLYNFVLARVELLSEELKFALGRLALLGPQAEKNLLVHVQVDIKQQHLLCQSGILQESVEGKLAFVHSTIYDYVRNYLSQTFFEQEARLCLHKLSEQNLDADLNGLNLAATLHLQLRDYKTAGEYYFRLCLAAQKAGFYDYGLTSIVKALHTLQDKLPFASLLKLRLLQLNLIKARFGWNSPQLATVNHHIESLCIEHGNSGGTAALMFNQWLFHLMGLNFRQALVTAEALSEFAAKKQDNCANVQGVIAQSNCYFWLGQQETSIALAQQALDNYCSSFQGREIAEFGQDSRVIALLFLVLNHSLMGNWDSARQFDVKLSELATKVNPFSKAISLQAKLFFYYHSDDPQTTYEFAIQLKELAEQQQFPFFIGIARLFLGWSHGLLTSEQEGVEQLKGAYHNWLAKSGERLSYSVYSCMVSELKLRGGEYLQAMDELRTAIGECERNQELTYLSHLIFLLSQARLRENPASTEAGALYTRAVELAQRQKALALIEKFAHYKR